MGENAESVMRRVREKYARCSSYVDSGVATSTFNKNIRTTFTTHFLSPNNFCFEWQKISDNGESFPKCGVWSNGDHTRIRIQKLEVVPSLAVGIASASGASQGAAHLIASLLILKIRLESSVAEFAGLEIDETKQVDGMYVLAGRNRTFWISSSDYSIKRFENNFWSDAVKCELEAREKQLAKTLNRPVLDSDAANRWIITYEFGNVSFQNNLKPAHFGLPWRDQIQ
jgi:hypothetical protein